MRRQKFSFGRVLCLGALCLGMMGAASAERVLHRANGGEPQTLDQAHTSINIEEFILKDLFEGLTVYDATGTLVPGAAQGWTISPDATVYTFTLRPQAKWSDGSDLTAADFVFSFRRIEDPKTAAGYANLLYPIKNAEKVNRGELPVEQLGVEALGAKTLRITLERPTPFFLQLLTNQSALPVNEASLKKNGKDFIKPGVMVSNGAFRLVGYVPNDRLTMARNDHYWDATHVKLDKVVFYPTEDQSASVRRFEAGEMDVMFGYPADQYKRLSERYPGQAHVETALATYYYAFDTRQPPFSDVRVRRALSMAIDRDFLAQEIYGGTRVPAYALVPPGIASYGAPTAPTFAALPQLEREDRALALMASAGYGPGGKPLEIEVRYNTSRDHERVATAVADMWKRVFGAKVKLVNLDVSSHYAYLQEGGKFNVARAGWIADYADAETFLGLSVSGNQTFNYGRFSNAAYDALMKRSYDERDPAVRARTLHEAEALLMQEQPMAPLLTITDLWLVSNRVKGWHDNVVNQHLSRFLSLSE
ncbi:ABC transporter substrate-binding protein [Bordetella genomosp. 1]|uniref:ABC transporter substrate-binding protein n=1 Tax=Bordetella genomosp. 1 TaxID=1395607 RepID=A0A261SPJ1_9BORD|nr:peptide ABC transporter substrate-binding protein [Bordetella genomosp. 1]OZI39309.1 ABC transporter substrate-binding protein [Bordetella genomosp. 1]